MKRFDDMSDAEVLALTDEQIAYCMDYECAKEGAPLMPPDYGPVPTVVEPQQDVTLYQVGSFFFTTMEDAERVAAVVNGARRMKTDYARGGSYKDRIVKPDDVPESVTSDRYYSPAGWDAVRVKVTAYNAAKEAWETAKSDYEKCVEKRSAATEWISNRIEKVRENDRERRRFESELARYVEIAQGDEQMARAFLLKARPEAAEFLPPLEAPADAAV